MKTYQRAFILALVGNVVLIGSLAALWWRYRAPHALGNGPSMPPSEVGPSANPAESVSASTEIPLAPVQLSPEKLQSIGVKIGEVRRKVVTDEIRATGNVAVNETQLAYVQTRFSGYIQETFADATYQYVRKGQPLFTIYSPDLVATEREYLVAKQNQQQVADSTVPGVAPGATSLLNAAAERLKQWGVSHQEIERLESTGQVQQELEVDSPVSGYITERNALPNLTVQPETRLYSIADLSTVWVLSQFFQNDLARIKIGDAVALTVDTFPGRAFSGRVNFIYPQVDMETRTAKVRIVLPNPHLELKPGMFVNVSLKVPTGKQLVVPASATLQSGTRQIVFVDRGGGYLEPREVQLDSRAGDDFIVLKGLKEGEKVVTSANFLIDSESQLQAALGSFVPAPPGAGAASTMNAAKGNAELSSDPSPPHKGSNVFRVKLTDSSGAPISGAEISLTLFMAAMPAMGMAAMRTPVTLSEKGAGTYEGSGQLETGGTWQVTIVARKDGQTIATKQLRVNATGGM